MDETWISHNVIDWGSIARYIKFSAANDATSLCRRLHRLKSMVSVEVSPDGINGHISLTKLSLHIGIRRLRFDLERDGLRQVFLRSSWYTRSNDTMSLEKLGSGLGSCRRLSPVGRDFLQALKISIRNIDLFSGYVPLPDLAVKIS